MMRNRITGNESVAAKCAYVGTGTMLKTDIREGVLGLDARTHLFVIVLFGLSGLLIKSILFVALLQAIALLYLVGNGRFKFALRLTLGFIIVVTASYLPIPGLLGVLFVSLAHMMPACTAACALFTLSPSAIMGSLSRWNLPRQLLIGTSMLFRFVPVLFDEISCIVRGIRMRGIFPGILDTLSHPALVYECLYTPLVMRCLKLSSELAASAELRGIEADGVRSSVHHVGFGTRDASSLILGLLLCTAFVVGDMVL